jgi:tetratricopeptide (TPR) repeat protein
VILKHLAGLLAMQDQFEAAHAALARAQSHLETLGPTMTAAITQPAAFIAMLAGDPATAEVHLRFAYDSLSQMGEKDNLATEAALLARAIAAQGEKRYDEASELIAISEEAAAGEDIVTQILGQGLSARMMAGQGRYAEAADLAFATVALAAQTDLLGQHADALLDLAQVLTTSGRIADASDAAAEALALYQRKGSLPGIREALSYLAQPEPIREETRRVAHEQRSAQDRT